MTCIRTETRNVLIRRLSQRIVTILNARSRSISAVFFSVVLSYAFIAHLFILFAPWQLDGLEGGLLYQVDGQLRGIPVYAKESFPNYFNCYGAGYNTIAVLFSRVFGEGFFALRLVTLLAILFSVGLFYDILRVKRVDHLLRLALCTNLYIGLLFFTTPRARPDGVAFVTLMLSFWLYERFGDDSWNLFAIILLSMVGLLTKQYFVIIAPITILYVFLYRSKIKGLYVGALFVATTIITYEGYNRLLPGYLPLAIGVNSGAATRISPSSILWMLGQNVGTFVMFSGSICLCFVCRAYAWKPLLRKAKSLSYSEFCGLATLTILTFKLGLHEGQSLVYYIQLFMPYLLVSLAAGGYPRTDLRSERRMAALLVTYALTLFVVYKAITSPMRTLRVSREMNAMYQDILPFHHVFASSWLTSVEMAQGKVVQTSGQNTMLPYGAFPEAWHLRGAKLSAAELVKLDADAQARIADNIAHQRFDLIVTRYEEPWIVEEMANIRAHYKPVAVRAMDREMLTEWVPK